MNNILLTIYFFFQQFIPKDIVRATDRVDDVKIETTDISNKFKFFETYQPKEERKAFRMTPPRETDKVCK